ncbi:MAG: SUMF1/EgtB/PvdO family nonheme iron enzyme, partial [Planctomycetota bacterium]|nr:SUMF1/EgtB/PvdO family nonheme iron enzyme [Planctomycetota bacterium]
AAGAVLLVIGIAALAQLATSSSRMEQRIDEWMAEARRSPDPSLQKVRANQVLLLEPGHKEATEILAAAHVFAPLLAKVEEARNVRSRMSKLLREQLEAVGRDPRYLQRLAREVEAIERRAEETAAVLELGVLPDLALLPTNYSGRRLEDEVRQLANVLRGRRTIEVQDFPAGAEVLLVPPVARGEKVLAWDRSRSLGVVPLRKTQYSLDPGSYVLIFRRPGKKREILMPLRITRTTPPVLSIRCPVDPVELPAGMLYVAGMEAMEYGDARFYEKPRRVTIESFLIDENEVTNAMYGKFVSSMDPRRARHVVPRRATGAAGATIPLWSKDDGGLWIYPEGSGDHPVTGISLSDARAYAESVGKRLPTPEEWERAARGVDRREYPFGDGLDTSACNTDTGSVSPVGTYPRDRSPFGVLDLAGNVAEWTEDGSAGAEATLKGGSFDLPRFRAIVTSFLKRRAESTYSDVGFRCALSLEDLKR